MMEFLKQGFYKTNLRKVFGIAETFALFLFIGTSRICGADTYSQIARKAAPFIDRSAIQQQNHTVSGIVVDTGGEAVIYANILEKGTGNGVVTDINGKFTIKVSPAATLVISCIGYISREISAGNLTTLEIILKEDNQLLEEIVIVGYGSVKKRDLTGAVSSVKAEELTAFTVSNPVIALQGRVPGVSISQNTGDPEGDYSIRIRGVNSIKGNNTPLYIIDGIPSSTASINTYDIESVEVLKDASATAIYGSRGANGVVLITTKRGTAGKARVAYDFEYGFQSQIKKLNLMDSKEWAQFYNEYLVNSKTLDTPPFSSDDIAAMGKGTDWQELMFKDVPMVNHSLTVTGGAENTKYFISASALTRDGLIPNSSYDKYNLRSSLDFAVNPQIDVSLQLGYSLIEKMNQSDGGGNGGSSMIGSIFSASPLFTPYDENGNYKDLRSWFSWSSHEVKNPLSMAYESSYKTVTNLTNVNTSITCKPLKGLSIKATFGMENSDARYDAYTTLKYIYQNNSASVNHNRYTTIVNEDIVNYNFTLNNAHKFDLMAGYTYQQYVHKTLAASGNTFLSDVTYTNDLGSAGTINTPTTSYTKWGLMSYLSRINYSFNGKYLATVSIRADGSSRYSANQRWGYFPSGALAWRISDEPFMKGLDKLSNMKIRLGYGQTGSTAIDPYSTQNLLVSGKTATGNGNYTYYAPTGVYPGDLKWETTSQWDAGLDVSLFNHRLRITADYYYKLTTDLLNTVYLPASSGYSSTTQNIGSMSNRGFELLLDADVIRTKDFDFIAQFNIAHNKNRVEKLSDGADIFGTIYSNYGSGAITIIREGEPLGAFYTYKDVGLNENGSLAYEDINKDEQYTDLDDRYIAGSPYPDFTYGLNCGFRYGNWDFNFFFQGSHGNDVFNLSEMRNYSYGQGMNIERKVYYESWREGQDNSKAHYPKIEAVGSLKYSDRFLEDGSYLRLKNICLAYNFPCTKWSTGNWLQGIRLFISAQNYLTFTKYRGVDPEVSSKGSDIDNGIDHLTYPNSKTLSLGAKIQF
ncbi:MAG: TonB-dependent receptor [Dysgonamonadaceae bacterium]|jgi:TonB-linked SusC/RagA family outer membrane protein|nr:TonB-dependent receptor [Dysgonamonadaceae bacterium]